MTSFADPVRSQAVRWTAAQSLLALERIKRGGSPSARELESLVTFGSDLDELAAWEGSVRDDVVYSRAIASLKRDMEEVRESILFDAVTFTSDEMRSLRSAAAQIRELAEGVRLSPLVLDALEHTCTTVIRKLAPRARIEVNPKPTVFRS